MLVLWGRIASTESQSHWDDNGTLQRGESGSSETLLTNIGGFFGCSFLYALTQTDITSQSLRADERTLYFVIFTSQETKMYLF